VRRATLRAVTRVNPEQASKVRDVDADPALTGGRPPRGDEEPTHAVTAVHRGSGNGTQGRFFGQRGRPGRLRGCDPQRRIRWRVGRESERPTVLTKPRNGGGGKGPHFWVRPLVAKDTEIGVSLQTPDRVRRLQRALYVKAKQDGAVDCVSLA